MIECKDCKFSIKSQVIGYYFCEITLPAFIACEGNTRVEATDGCDLGKPKEEKNGS